MLVWFGMEWLDGRYTRIGTIKVLGEGMWDGGVWDGAGAGRKGYFIKRIKKINFNTYNRLLLGNIYS